MRSLKGPWEKNKNISNRMSMFSIAISHSAIIIKSDMTLLIDNATYNVFINTANCFVMSIEILGPHVYIYIR